LLIEDAEKREREGGGGSVWCFRSIVNNHFRIEVLNEWWQCTTSLSTPNFLQCFLSRLDYRFLPLSCKLRTLLWCNDRLTFLANCNMVYQPFNMNLSQRSLPLDQTRACGSVAAPKVSSIFQQKFSNKFDP